MDPGNELGQTFEALSDSRKRRVLDLLAENGEMTLTALAADLAASEAGAPTDSLTRSTVNVVRVDLYHRHLPQLADLGLVDDVDDETRVRLTNEGAAVEGFLDDLVGLAER